MYGWLAISLAAYVSVGSRGAFAFEQFISQLSQGGREGEEWELYISHVVDKRADSMYYDL